MIWQRQEFVQDETEDSDFPIKQVDRLEALQGDDRRFIGRATLNMQTPMGVQQLPISFEIEANDVEEAFEKYSETARPKIDELREQMRQRLEQMRQQMEQQEQQGQQAKRIVTPTGGDILKMDDLRKQ